VQAGPALNYKAIDKISSPWRAHNPWVRGPDCAFFVVPVNKELLTGTVSVNKELLTGTVPVNNSVLN
jgi:hypothetical protein